MSLNSANPAGMKPVLRILILCGVLALAGAAALWLYDLWPAVVGWIQLTQRSLHRELAEAMKLARDAGPVAAWGLISLSFLYGVFHAAGPGHGKMVISTYLVSHGVNLKRGLMISALSSLAQGVTAVVAVEAAVAIFRIPFRDTREAAANLELMSYILVTAMGLFLAITAARKLLGGHHHHCHDHGHGHSHSHRHSHGAESSGSGIDGNKWHVLAVIGSVGIRPCSGAILVLLFAQSLDMRLEGIAAVFAMSAGTAITVSTLAVIAVNARALAIRLSHFLPAENTASARIGTTVSFGGGLIILALGVSLILSALETAKHPLM